MSLGLNLWRLKDGQDGHYEGVTGQTCTVLGSLLPAFRRRERPLHDA